MKTFGCTLVFVCLLAPLAQAHAQSSSENYVMWAQTQAAGGAYTTSESFRAFSSTGDLSDNPGASTNFNGVFGFQALTEEPVITVSLSATNVTFSPNPLTIAGVSTASTTVTVSTNADFGYTLSATELSPLKNQSGAIVADVADGAVTTASEEWGIAVSGADAAFGDDQALSATPLTIASRTIWGADRTTTATFKAAIAVNTDAGTYTANVTFIATGNY